MDSEGPGFEAPRRALAEGLASDCLGFDAVLESVCTWMSLVSSERERASVMLSATSSMHFFICAASDSRVSAHHGFQPHEEVIRLIIVVMVMGIIVIISMKVSTRVPQSADIGP